MSRSLSFFATLFFGMAISFGFFWIQQTAVSQEEIGTTEENLVSRAAYNGVLNPTCGDNYETWENSTVFRKNALWSTAFIPASTGDFLSDVGSFRTFLSFDHDLNGDALPDFVFLRRHYYNGSFSLNSNGIRFVPQEDCVYLSNGQGWDLAYRCVTQLKTVDGVSTPYFYGDCADV